MKVRITVSACDGSTTVKRDVNKSQLAFLQALASDISAEGGGCDPTMTIICGKDFEKARRDGSHYKTACDKDYDHPGECGWRY